MRLRGERLWNPSVGAVVFTWFTLLLRVFKLRITVIQADDMVFHATCPGCHFKFNTQAFSFRVRYPFSAAWEPYLLMLLRPGPVVIFFCSRAFMQTEIV